MRFAAVSVVTSLLASSAMAWEEPPRGSDLRGDLLNTARVVAALDLNAPIEFVVRDLRHDGGVAFASLQPQRPGGAPIAWNSTRLAAKGEQADWYDGTAMHVFLFRQGGHWYIQDYSIGATDVWWHRSPLCDAYRSVIPEFCQ